MGDTIPKLIILSETQRGQTFPLQEALYTIGRSDQCSICIKDPTVSSTHCELSRNEDGNYTVNDLDSTNGTRINGIKISNQSLSHTDILQVGGVEIMYDRDEEKGSRPGGEKTVISLNVGNSTRVNERMGALSPIDRRKGLTSDPRVKLFFKFFIPALVIVVIVLMGMLVWMLMQNG